MPRKPAVQQPAPKSLPDGVEELEPNVYVVDGHTFEGLDALYAGLKARDEAEAADKAEREAIFGEGNVPAPAVDTPIVPQDGELPDPPDVKADQSAEERVYDIRELTDPVDEWYGPFSEYARVQTPFGGFAVSFGYRMKIVEQEVWDAKEGRNVIRHVPEYEKVKVKDPRLAPSNDGRDRRSERLLGK